MLQQAIHLVQLSNVELQELLQKELAENPLLEEAATEDEAAVDGDFEMPPFGTPPVVGEHGPDLPFDVAEVLFGPLDDGAPVQQDTSDESCFGPAGRTPTSLRDHLGEQLRLTTVEPGVRTAAEQIITNVDDDGYLRATLEEIAEQPVVPVAIVETALRVVQGFDPRGVAARDLRECLLIQLRDPARGSVDRLAIEIVEHHVEALQHARYAEIARVLAVDLACVMEAVQRIVTLEPEPGRNFAPVDTHDVVPDVRVTGVGDDYVIILNEDGMSRLWINSHYRRVIGHEYATRRYLEDRLQAAFWLIRSIQQRQKLLYTVTRSIVQFQREFLDKGLAHLRLLSLRDVADDTNLHESTVRRVITGKFVETPQGTFPLRFFFLPGSDPDHFPDDEEEPPDPDGPAPPVATAAAAGSRPGLEWTDARGYPYRSPSRVVQFPTRGES